MKLKLLLFAIIALTITSCSTAYKSGQTPDDVYYSPARFEEDKREDDENRQDEQDRAQATEDRRVRQMIRDRRWREFNDFDYTFNNSPYNYCYCNCNYTGYYYNPYFYSSPIFNTSVIKSTPPRKVNLSAYQGYSPNGAGIANSNTKFGTRNTSTTPRYNNTNRKEGFLNKVSKIFNGSSSTESNSNSSSGSNNTRSYSPSSSGSSSSGGGGSISRPSRGGK
jgi:uncharacterized membrane protein YgcG